MLRDAFVEVFDINRPLREMIGGPMKIVLNDDAQSYAIPFAWREKTKDQLDKLLRDDCVVRQHMDWSVWLQWYSLCMAGLQIVLNGIIILLQASGFPQSGFTGF
ncbi:hypothetical protein FJT64_005783 [Amphibalanus amphitrite]|uniref:Uncharacterized protein n=1 Tax=Amphibalanus amphitrite TaxID=1232801 RepID=A0A6A4VV11_AMPAM|nr:hypothetical protein FJT64_005783 [Amphibalanus amphitrite]